MLAVFVKPLRVGDLDLEGLEEEEECNLPWRLRIVSRIPEPSTSRNALSSRGCSCGMPPLGRAGLEEALGATAGALGPGGGETPAGGFGIMGGGFRGPLFGLG